MRKIHCKICSKKTSSKIVITRSKIKKKLFSCKKCDFDFFNYDPRKNLEKNKLDLSRLKKAGIKVPSIQENFERTMYQSQFYAKKYLKLEDKNKRILEIGCSHGSFLHVLKKKGFKPYGVELNDYLRKKVQSKLKIKCFKTTDEISNLKFSKIFLFYCIEYFIDFKKEINLIKKFLDPKGEIIIITPNKNDILKSLFLNKSYDKFFYDINSINYFSVKSLNKLMKKLNFLKYKITCKQGYGIANLFNWSINQKPSKTGLVGEDDFMLRLFNNFKIRKVSKYENSTIKEIKLILSKMEKKYKKYLEKKGFGNQIILKIIK